MITSHIARSASLGLGLAVAGTALADPPPNYLLIDINAFQSGTYDGQDNDASGIGVSDNGQFFVGKVDDAGSCLLTGLRANFVWTGGTQTTELVLLLPYEIDEDSEAVAYDVLNDRTAVGRADKLESSVLVERPTVWIWDSQTQEDTKVNLTTLGHDPYDVGEAHDIDDNLQIVGRSQTSHPEGYQHACYWAWNSQAEIWDDPVDLGTLTGGTDSAPWAINSSGNIVGWSKDSSARTRAVLWTPAGGGSWNDAIDLGTLGGAESCAFDINHSNVIVGWAQTDDDPVETHAVKWTYSGGQWTPTDLGTLGGDFSTAYGINSSGVIVGGATDSQSSTHKAVAWFGGQIHNLNEDSCFYPMTEPERTWTLTYARMINDDGLIVGGGLRSGTNHTDWLRAYALRPIACLTDANGDGAVDVEDLLIVLANWD